jgi:asparagine synthase (glutamine-hydrolysing)
MCGIVGIVSNFPIERRAWLLKGRDAMIHRGPDDAGEWWSADRRVGLAHRRLSIVDLSPAGHQPMHDATENLAIVFNGEIYNYLDLKQELKGRGYVFNSHTDTEVILSAYLEWGTECLSRLNGMFAFALYDARIQKIFLARDRAGEKPLFYAQANGELRFASELKGLMVDSAFSHSINYEALDCYLSMGYIPGDHCMVQGVNKLPPAHAMLFDCAMGTIKVWRYWHLPEPDVDTASQIDENALLDELETLLQDAVRRQLVADVPVGVLLSGGVDSSLITAMAVRESSRVKTFNVGFPSFDKYDETPHARLIAKNFGTEHIELKADDISPDLLPILARQYDEPMVDSSMIPTYLVSQLVRQHCTVALGGDGGDELFGGYAYYNRLLWTQQKFGWIPRTLRKPLAIGGSMLPTGFKGRHTLQSLGSDLSKDLPSVATYFDPLTRHQLLSSIDYWSPVAEKIRSGRVPQTADLLQRVTRMDFNNYLAEDILVKVDRASMLTSLEIRAPLLDYRIIELAFGRVPSSLKTTIDQRKILLKRLAARILPPEFDLQRKHGFSIPLSNWLRSGPWRDMFYEVLLDKQCLFNRNTVSQLLQGQDSGKHNSERLFSLVLFELWRREYQIS